MKLKTLTPWLGPTAVAAMLLTASVFFVNRAAEVQLVEVPDKTPPVAITELFNESVQESVEESEVARDEAVTEVVEKVSSEQVLDLLESADPKSQLQAQQLVLALALSEDFQKKALALELLPLLPGLSRDQKKQFGQLFCSRSLEPLRFEAEYLRARWLRSQSTHYSLKKMRIPCLESQGHSS